MRALALESPQGGRLGIGKQRSPEDKVREGTGRGYVCSAWICERHRGDCVRWPSFQASHSVELRPCLLSLGPRREGCSHTPHFVLEESAPTPSPQVSSEASCSMRQVPVRTGTTHTLSSSWAWEGLCLGLS